MSVKDLVLILLLYNCKSYVTADCYSWKYFGAFMIKQEHIFLDLGIIITRRDLVRRFDNKHMVNLNIGRNKSLRSGRLGDVGQLAGEKINRRRVFESFSYFPVGEIKIYRWCWLGNNTWLGWGEEFFREGGMDLPWMVRWCLNTFF